jgi:peptide/nickel transport system substrate-binding protein
MNKNEFSRVFLSILFMALMFAGTFAVSHAQDQTPKLGGTFVVGRAAAEPTALSYWMRGGQGVQVSSNIFSALVGYDAAYNLVPDLAQSWDFSSDMLTWTFHLVKNATWHDGVPFTSADVKFTYDKLILLDPSGKAYFSSDDLSSITTSDNYTVVFHWKHPFLDAMYYMNAWTSPIGPKHLFEASCPATPCNVDDYRKNEWINKPIGTGAFKFQEWVRGDHITLVKNQNYFKKGLPYLDKLVFVAVPDASTLLTKLKSGQIDYMPEGVPYAQVPELNKDPAFNPVPLQTTSIGQTVRLMFNLDLPILKDVRVRQAISLAIDRQTIVDKAAFGLAKVSKSMFPDSPNMAKYRSPNVPYPKQDLAAAEKLLDDAGYKRGADGVRFTFDRFLVSTGEPQANIDPASLIKDMLKKVGIETKIVAIDESTKYTMMYVDRPRNFDIAMNRQRAGPTPYVTMKMLHSSYSNQRAYATNISYNNTEIDKLYDQAKVVKSMDEMVQIFQKVDEILNRDRPHLWIYDYMYAQAKRNTFRGASFYDIIPESGPIESVWWTQGTPIVTAIASTATAQTMTPTVSPEWIGVAVIAVIVLAGAYMTYTRRKKKAN